ncbi:hypothetical protein FRC16_010401 [Serendipita sp. 398]|nr:hypothetical protein FRC16_010401 [Serendipita sp. 398]
MTLFLLTIAYWASLVSLAFASAEINIYQGPEAFTRCNVSEFKWTGAGPSWRVDVSVYNGSKTFDYSVTTQNNNSFKMVIYAPTGDALNFRIHDPTNSSIMSAGWLLNIREATSECDTALSNIDMIIFDPFPNENSTTNPTRHSQDVNLPLLISLSVLLVLVVLLAAGCLLCYIRRRQKRGRMPTRISVQSSNSNFFPSAMTRLGKKPQKSKDFLLEEESPTRGEEPVTPGAGVGFESTEQLIPTVLPRVPEANTHDLSHPHIPMGVMIPSSKELRMRGGVYAREDYAPSINSTNDSLGETFRTDTVSVWPTQTDPSTDPESGTSQSRSMTSGGSNGQRRGEEGQRRQRLADPNSLYALVGQEVQQILQEQQTNGSPATIRGALTPISAVNEGGPWRTTTSITTTTTTTPAAAVPSSVTNNVVTPVGPTPAAASGSSSKPPLPALSIPVSPAIAEPGSAVTPHSGSSRKPMRRRDMEALTDLVAQRLARPPRRGDTSRYDAPPSYS